MADKRQFEVQVVSALRAIARGLGANINAATSNKDNTYEVQVVSALRAIANKVASGLSASAPQTTTQTGGGVTLTFEEEMGMTVTGNGTRNLGVELDNLREIPYKDKLVKNNHPALDAVKTIVVCEEYPSELDPPGEEDGNTLYIKLHPEIITDNDAS